MYHVPQQPVNTQGAPFPNIRLLCFKETAKYNRQKSTTGEPYDHIIYFGPKVPVQGQFQRPLHVLY